VVYAEQLITSFIASAAFGILFNAPKESLFKCGLSGMLGWIVYFALTYQGYGPVLGTLAAAFLIALVSQMFAKFYKTPIIIFSVAGIIPLVPGGLAYDTMRNIVENDYTTAVALGVKASMISGAIAVGLIFSEVINHVIRRPSIHPDKAGR
jgi:uncharacterized membrane protein YjjB (DUF3815 family)